MKIDIINLTEKNLKEAPEWKNYPFSCKYCLYWEFPEENIDTNRRRKEDLIQKKLNWLHNTNRIFGNCGKIAYSKEKPIAYAQYAPAKLLPRSHFYSTGPPSNDSVLISCLFIPKKEFRRQSIGSQILECIIDDLRKRGAKAVETFARKGKSDNPSGPIELYLNKGFRIFRDHPEFPLMRLNL